MRTRYRLKNTNKNKEFNIFLTFALLFFYALTTIGFRGINKYNIDVNIPNIN
jgi:hypothetical protein